MISAELRAELRRLYYAEHWRVGTIASALGVHPGTVKGAIEAHRFVKALGRARPTKLDPYLPFMRETLERYPRLRSTRLYVMVKERGFVGSETQVLRVEDRDRGVLRADVDARGRAGRASNRPMHDVCVAVGVISSRAARGTSARAARSSGG